MTLKKCLRCGKLFDVDLSLESAKCPLSSCNAVRIVKIHLNGSVSLRLMDTVNTFQDDILKFVFNHPSCKINDVSLNLKKPYTTTKTNVRKLKKSGYIRAASCHPGRTQLLSCTEKYVEMVATA